jgi:integrase
MARKKMSKGDESRIAARKRLTEIKRTVPDGMGGTRRMSFYGASKPEAESSCQRYLRSLRAAPGTASLEPGTIAWWLKERYTPLKVHLRPSTVKAIEGAAKHLSRQIGAMQASKIGASEIAKAIANVQGSASLKNKVRTVAYEVMELAAEEDPEVRLVSRKRVKPSKQKAPKIDVLSPQDARRLAESVPPMYRPTVLLMAFLGLRSGEAIAVLGADVTPIGSLLVRRQDDGYGGWTDELKTEESYRELPLPAGLLAALAPYRGAGALPLSRTRFGTGVSENNVRRAVNAAKDRLGLSRCDGHTLHSLRHGASTWLAMNGCPRGLRLAILGQSRGDVQDRYVHSSAADMVTWLTRMWEASEGADAPTFTAPHSRKTAPKGTLNGRSKLTPTTVLQVKEALSAPSPNIMRIAREFGVSPKTVRNVRDGKTWVQTSTEGVVAATTSKEDRIPAI